MSEQIIRKIQALQTELDALRQEVKERPVGYVYDATLSTATISYLVKEARLYEDWLAKKTRAQGQDAAVDSGEAKICALLREFMRRFDE